MRTAALTLAFVLSTFACAWSPVDGARAGALAGSALCGVGGVASAATDLDWVSLLTESACWIGRWQAERFERLSAAQDAVERSNAAAELSPLDRAAVELAAADATMRAEPCDANAAALAGALAKCQALTD